MPPEKIELKCANPTCTETFWIHSWENKIYCTKKCREQAKRDLAKKHKMRQNEHKLEKMASGLYRCVQCGIENLPAKAALEYCEPAILERKFLESL